MKLIAISRRTKLEKRYTEKMGMLSTKVTYIRQTLLGIPLKTLYAYRKTYYGKVKECNDCVLSS